MKSSNTNNTNHKNNRNNGENNQQNNQQNNNQNNQNNQNNNNKNGKLNNAAWLDSVGLSGPESVKKIYTQNHGNDLLPGPGGER